MAIDVDSGTVLLRGEVLEGGRVVSMVNHSRPCYRHGVFVGFERGPTSVAVSTAVDSLNPGIRKVVALLRSHGFSTCDSGDGATHDYECDRDAPYVCIECDPERLVHECRRLARVLAAAGITIEPIDPDGAPCIQGTHDPANDRAIIELMGVDDSMLQGES